MREPPFSRAKKRTYERDFVTRYGAYDILVLFLERSIRLLKEGGVCGFIVSNKFMVSDYGSKLRKFLTEKCEIKDIVDLADARRVFSDALVSTVILIMQKTKPSSEYSINRLIATKETQSILSITFDQIPISKLIANNGTFNVRYDNKRDSIYEKISRLPSFSDYFDIRTGIMGFEYWKMKPFIHEGKMNRGDIRIATNSYIDQYRFLWGKKINLYKRNFTEPYADPSKMPISKATRTLFVTKGKILVRGVSQKLTGMIDSEGVAFLVAVHSIVASPDFPPEFVLGLINSRFFNWIHKDRFYLGRIPEGSLKYPVSFFKELPLPDKVKPNTKSEIVSLVKQNIKLHSSQNIAQEDDEETNTKDDRIQGVNDAIDKLVYGDFWPF